ncbi:hypothetical protein N9Y00_06995 [Tateyamaria sp.]|nr:hypothetical protein [Tateyamaria sp.]
MPKFEFTLTRDVTESANVVIEADTIEEAQAKALENPPPGGWAVDDNDTDGAYLPDPDDFLEVQPPEMQNFTVNKLVDAYVVYAQVIEATTAEEAKKLAIDEGAWEYSHVSDFDATDYTVHDAHGTEVIGI